MMSINRLFNNGLIKSTGIYTVAKLLNSSVPFLLLPIMTSYLSPGDYGVIYMITTIVSFTTPFVTLNTDSAIIRRYYYKDNNLAMYIGSCILIVLSMCVIVTLFMVLISTPLYHYSNVPSFVLYFIPLYCVIVFFKNILLYYWQVNEQAIKYGVVSILATMIEASIAILLIVVVGLKWEGRALSLVLSGILVTLLSITYLSKHRMIQMCANNDNMKHAIKYGSGLIPHSIGISLMVLVNNFFLTNMIGIEEAGLYGVANSFAGIMSFITLSFNNAYVPWLFKNLAHNSDKEKRKIVKITYIYMFFLIIVGVVVLGVVSFIFPFFVNKNFDGSVKYLPFLLLGMVFQGYYFMVTNYIMYSEKTYYNGMSTIIAGLFNVLFNYVFITKYGAVGASVAFAVTYLYYFLQTWFIANRVYKMPWNLLKKCD